MAKCCNCGELRDHAPEFVSNGVTDFVAQSLKENLGLNKSATELHNDCTDLNMANDCLIGNMGGNLDAYDTCEWKDAFKVMLENQYQMNKATISALCGVWSYSENINKKIDGLVFRTTRVVFRANTFQKRYDLGSFAMWMSGNGGSESIAKVSVGDITKIERVFLQPMVHPGSPFPSTALVQTYDNTPDSEGKIHINIDAYEMVEASKDVHDMVIEVLILGRK